jgi:hypothetical protein
MVEGNVRTIQTFVLRLLVDMNEPQQLRGSLHSVADNADHPFANAQVLLDLLRQIMQLESQIPTNKNNEQGDSK